MQKTFNLPDLGEGLPEAEVISWHVSEGQRVNVDDLLVSVETAKAVVEVPSPYTGVIAKLHAAPGEMVQTGQPLVDFTEVDEPPRTADHGETGATPASPAEAGRVEPASVVGEVPSSDELLVEHAPAGSRRQRKAASIKAAPAARALARRLGVDLHEVTASGRGGQITPEDVQAHAQTGGTDAAPLPWRGGALHGPRRAMARSMTTAREQVVPCTLFDDADIQQWRSTDDISARLLRAIVAGCRAEPVLNGFYSADNETHELADRVDIALAVDTADGLIVPVVRDAASKSLAELRSDVQRIKQATRTRSIRPQDTLDYTFTLSNFGMLTGRYATPVLIPPSVAILGAGRLAHDVVAVLGGIEVHRRLPLSLTFDHRCITGAEACRFLGAVIADLAEPE